MSLNVIERVAPNGLKLVCHCNVDIPMMSMVLLYKTGSRDERPGRTGLAHLFEHNMFGGSECVPDFDGTLELAGGNNNAWTSNDFTCFHEEVPVVNAATAFFVESDRMRHPLLSQQVLDVQRSVVIEEFKQQCLNRPYGDLWHTLREAFYGGTHPYSWPVIGRDPKEIEAMTTDDLRQWWEHNCAPSNAVLAITGGLPPEQAVELFDQWFATIPARKAVERHLSKPELPTSDHVITTHGLAPQPMVVIAFPMDSFGTPGYYAADVITDILAAGPSGRLYRKLVVDGDGLFAEANASIIGSEHEGMLIVQGRITNDAPQALERARQQLIDECRCLAVEGNVTQHELERALNRFACDFKISNIDYTSLGRNLALATAHGYTLDSVVPRQRQVDLELLRHTAANIFGSPSVTVNYLPRN